MLELEICEADADEDARREKIRENRLRRMAQRQGLRLIKSRVRDPRALDYGRWWIANPDTNAIVAGELGFMDITGVERYLGGDEAATEHAITPA
jgi:hypothetical protein